MNLKALAETLATDPSLTPAPVPKLVTGKTLFVHAMPPDAKFGVMLRDYFGGTEIDAELPDMRHATFQCIVRGPNYEQAENLAKAISAKWNFDANPVVNPVVIGTMSMRYIRPRIEPLVFPMSAGSLWEFLVNFDVCYNLLP